MLAAIKGNKALWLGFDILDEHIEERLFEWITLQNSGITKIEHCQHCQNSREISVYDININEINCKEVIGDKLPIGGAFDISLNRRECRVCGEIDIEGELYLY